MLALTITKTQDAEQTIRLFRNHYHAFMSYAFWGSIAAVICALVLIIILRHVRKPSFAVTSSIGVIGILALATMLFTVSVGETDNPHSAVPYDHIAKIDSDVSKDKYIEHYGLLLSSTKKHKRKNLLKSEQYSGSLYQNPYLDRFYEDKHAISHDRHMLRRFSVKRPSINHRLPKLY